MNTPRPIPGWHPSTPAITGPGYDDLIRRHPAVLIHFWAAWNAHDRAMDGVIRAIQGRFAGRVHFASCDIDQDGGELYRRFGVVNIPTLGLIVAGAVRKPSIIGIPEPDRLAAAIESRLASG